MLVLSGSPGVVEAAEDETRAEALAAQEESTLDDFLEATPS